MNVLQLYEYSLIELNKLEASSLLLEDFNYLINKAVAQFINKSYNKCEINQQSTDDLRSFKKTATLPLTNTGQYYVSVLPDRYIHILGVTLKYSISDNSSICNSQYTNNNIGCKRLTSDAMPQIMNNYYMKPKISNPYYHINGSNIDILCGNDSNYIIEEINVDYLESPITLNLTDEDIEYEEISADDPSKHLNCTDYVCYEIINEFVKLVLENVSDPRIQSFIPINKTIP